MIQRSLWALCALVSIINPVVSQAAVLADTSNITTGVGTGFNGANVSVIDVATSTTFGFSANSVAATIQLADDFTLSQNALVSAITVYAYSTSTYPSPPTSPFTGVTVKIWSGQPGSGGSVIATSSTLNPTAWTGVYRVTGTTLTSASRPVMSMKATFSPVPLTTGTYWVSYAVTGITAPGVTTSIFTPPMMNSNGSMPPGNAIQTTNGGTSWAAATDAATAATLTIPLLIEGAPAASATTTTLSSSCQTTFTQGQPFTLVSAVSGATPSGTVSFFANAASIPECQNVALTSGVAACTTTSLPLGSDSITGTYSGDSLNLTSTSLPLMVTVLDATDVVFRDNFEDIPATCPIQ